MEPMQVERARAAAVMLIELRRLEGEEFEVGLLERVRGPGAFASANTVLLRWSLSAPLTEAGHRVEVRVVWEENECVRLAVKLRHPRAAELDVATCVREHVLFFAGRDAGPYSVAEYGLKLPHLIEVAGQAHFEYLATHCDLGIDRGGLPPIIVDLAAMAGEADQAA